MGGRRGRLDVRRPFARLLEGGAPVFVAIGRIVLRIPGARSLKDRRQVVRSYKDRVKARLGISIAEVGNVEDHQLATLGLAAVARDASGAHDLLSQALSQAEFLKGGLVVDVRREVLPFGRAGSDIPGLDTAHLPRRSFDDAEGEQAARDESARHEGLDDEPDFDRWKRR